MVTAGAETVALRCPRGAVARGLFERVVHPIAAPSANSSNRISPTRAEHVLADLGGKIDLIIDSGPTTVGLESTVLDLAGGTPRILRPGPISRAELERVLAGRTVLDQQPGESPARPASPGQMPIHYAPRTPAYHVASLDDLAGLEDLESTALIVIGEHSGSSGLRVPAQFVLKSPESASIAALRCFAPMRCARPGRNPRRASAG